MIKVEAKKWYQSKKFFSVLVAAVLMVLNEGLDLNLPSEEIMTVAGVILGFIFTQGVIDYKDKTLSQNVHPIQDPMVREALESMVNAKYSFDEAQKIGIELHAMTVAETILMSFEAMIESKQLRDGLIKAEIMRQIFKKYNQDISMKEGADLILSQK